jgi:S-methylmethionine-dependent homocysteine/selenocysteine methylase
MTDNHILMGIQRQAELEAAKAAFFATGGQVIELVSYQYKLRPVRSEPERIPARQFDPADVKLAERITALRDAGLARYQVEKRIGICNRKLLRIIQTFGIDFPRAKGKRCDGPI